MNECIAPTKWYAGHAATWAVSFSGLPVLIADFFEYSHPCGRIVTLPSLVAAVVSAAVCSGTFVFCPRRFLIEKSRALLLLFPAIYQALKMLSYSVLTPDVLRFLHGWGL